MKAVWYDGFGPADKVLTYGDMAAPVLGEGEVLVRVRASGINPSDVKLRSGARPGAVMAFPRIVPHSDGAGVIEAVGACVDAARIGQRVWIWNGQWRRQYVTAAEYIALPADQAVFLPDNTSFAEGACQGIPAMTAWAAVLGDGPVEGMTVLVTGGAGTVGRYAIQMARLAGARVITTVSGPAKAAHAGPADHVINYREDDVAARVMEITGGRGVERIVEVDFGANLAVTEKIIAERGTVAAYASAAAMTPTLPFYPLMFKNTRLWMLIVYLLDPAMRRRGEAQLTAWLEQGALPTPWQ
ncbi:MAG TPA: NADPH:quinone reductase [Thermohalobaculum sp.]|nr:NADPH:quinone reductase [Thermohalobaculum sp.]